MRARLAAAAVCAAIVAALAISTCGGPEARRPNVLLVVVDTLRQDRLGAYGYQRNPTSPALDAFAAEEALLVDGLTAVTSWTMPSMATLFTGLSPAEHGVMRMFGESNRLADPRTLAAVLGEAGYATACVQGNFLLRVSGNTGFERGFDTYLDSPATGHRGSTAAEVARLGEGWLAGRGADQPWFLTLQFFDPHVAYEDHEAYRFEDPDYDGWVTGGLGARELRDRLRDITDADRRQLDAYYDEEVRAVDDAFGRLLEVLRSRPDWQDTLVVFTADHGEELAERGWIGHTRTVHFEQIDLPLVVRLPGGARAGERVEARLGQRGLYATLLELAGLPAEAGRGDSFAPLLRGEAAAPEEVVPVEVDFVPALQENSAKRTRLRAAVSDRHKLVHDLELGSWELYDLAEDPGERRDLADDPAQAEVLERLRAWIEGHRWWEGP